MRIDQTSAALATVLAGILTSAHPAIAAPADDAAFRDLYKELVEINTTRSVGSCAAAAEAMRAHLIAAGISTYGLSGMFHDAEGSHAHGLNERIRVKSLMDGRHFLYEVVKLYSNGKD